MVTMTLQIFLLIPKFTINEKNVYVDFSKFKLFQDKCEAFQEEKNIITLNHTTGARFIPKVTY